MRRIPTSICNHDGRNNRSSLRLRSSCTTWRDFLTTATTSASAQRGDPAENGGAGSYSSMSWISFATFSPCRMAARRRPMGRGAIAAQQPRRPEHQSARANRGHVARVLPLLAEEGEEFVVGERLVDAAASRHEQHVKLRRFSQERVRQDGQAAVTHNGVGARRHDMNARLRQPGKHLVRPREIELRQPRKQDHADGGQAGCSGWHVGGTP